MLHNLEAPTDDNRMQSSLRGKLAENQAKDSSIRLLLCDGCWAGPFAYRIFRRLMNGEDIRYATNWFNIKQAAEGGCGLCGLLATDMPEDIDSVTSDVTFSFNFGFGKNPTSTFDLASTRLQFLDYEIVGSEGDAEFVNNGVWLRTSHDDPAAAEIFGRDPLLEVNSPRCFSFAVEQINTCSRNHKDCPRTITESRLPTRVIDCLDPSHPRLFTSEGASGRYAALSYVWGEAQPNRTVQANLDSYMNAINPTLIPQTIREAVEVTHKLGLRFLWVDSYCIIQDSREDKTRELVQLRRIFRDAYITIIAACAPSASAGFLHDRPPPQSSPKTPRLPYWCADGRLGTMTVEPFNMADDWEREPINTRAWCLEERLMSPRKLVYASDTLQYHCQTGTISAGGAIVHPRAAERLQNVTFMPDHEILRHVSEWNAGRWKLFSGDWADVIFNYTRRAVTKPKDKLTALAGVAEQFHRVFRYAGDLGVTAATRARYLAGLWEPTLLNDLLWRRMVEVVPLRPRPSQYYLGPSWSWASVDGPVSLLAGYEVRLHPYRLVNSDRIRCARILSCEVTLEDERLPHGRVKEATLRLQATLLRTSWRCDGPPDPESLLYMARRDPDGSVQVVDAPPGDKDSRPSYAYAAEVYLDSTDEAKPGQDMWMLPILWNVDPSLEDTHAAGILVRKTGIGDCFARIGFWETPELGVLDDPEELEVMMRARLAWLETFDKQPASDSPNSLPLCLIELV